MTSIHTISRRCFGAGALALGTAVAISSRACAAVSPIVDSHTHTFIQGLPLAPDLQIQVLHILQEALSNARKHAGATQVWLDVQQQPQWRLEVRDDGLGFASEGEPPDETHVGLRIMAERAERLGAHFEVLSTPGRGTSSSGTASAAQPSRKSPASSAASPVSLERPVRCRVPREIREIREMQGQEQIRTLTS